MYQSQQLLTTHKIPQEFQTISPDANNMSIHDEPQMPITQLMKMPASALPGKVHDTYMSNNIDVLPTLKKRSPGERSVMKSMKSSKKSMFMRNASVSNLDRPSKKYVSAEEEEKMRKLIQSQYFRGLSAPDAYLKQKQLHR